MKDSRYAAAGVDIDAKAAALSRARTAIRSTFNPQVLGDVGGFGGLFAPDFSKYREPVLVASTDGVGTKLKVAIAASRHDTCGADLVNHCVNDILVQGARPLFFLDYLATGKIEPGILEKVIEGVARGCRENGTRPDRRRNGGDARLLRSGRVRPGRDDRRGRRALEDPGRLADRSRRPRARAAVDRASHQRLLPGAPGVLRKAGPKAGRHASKGLGQSIADALLAPHLSYLPALDPLLAAGLVHGMAHITGGGFYDNIPRVLPENVDVVIKAGAWPVLPVFEVIGREGSVSFEEMHRVFNMGIGMVVFVAPGDLASVAGTWKAAGQPWFAIGSVKGGGKRRVTVEAPPSELA